MQAKFLKCAALGVVAATAATVVGVTNAAPGAKPIVTTAYASTSNTWVVYNKKTCAFVPTKSHPAKYVAVLRKAPTAFKVAFVQPLTTGPFMAKWTPSMTKAAKQAGIKLRLFDDQYPSTTQPLVVADAVVQYKPAVVLEGNEQGAVFPAIMNKYNDACLPTVIPDLVPPKNAIFFAAKQSDIGIVGAKYAVKLIKQRGWSLSDVFAVSCENTEVGNTAGGPYDRVAFFQSEILKELPGIPKSNTTLLDCHQTQGSLDAQTQMTNWITAHPQAKYVVSNAITDVQALGMYSALKNANFGDKAILIGTDVDPGVMKIVMANDPIFVGDVNQFPEKRGLYEIPLALDIAAGIPVPDKVYSAPGVVHP